MGEIFIPKYIIFPVVRDCGVFWDAESESLSESAGIVHFSSSWCSLRFWKSCYWYWQFPEGNYVDLLRMTKYHLHTNWLYVQCLWHKFLWFYCFSYFYSKWVNERANRRGRVSMRYTMFLSIRVWTVNIIKYCLFVFLKLFPAVVWFCLNQNSTSLVHYPRYLYIMYLIYLVVYFSLVWSILKEC